MIFAGPDSTGIFRTEHEIIDTKIHPKYVSNDFDNDIAIVTVYPTFNFNHQYFTISKIELEMEHQEPKGILFKKPEMS